MTQPQRVNTSFPAYPGMPVATHPNAPIKCFAKIKAELTGTDHTESFETSYLVMGLLTARIEPGGVIEGTDPTLTLVYQGKDQLDRWVPLARLVVPGITADPVSMLVVGCTRRGRIEWQVGGTDSPRYTLVGISLEMR